MTIKSYHNTSSETEKLTWYILKCKGHSIIFWVVNCHSLNFHNSNTTTVSQVNIERN